MHTTADVVHQESESLDELGAVPSDCRRLGASMPSSDRPASGWVLGRIGGRNVIVPVRAQKQRICHTGYDLSEVARGDMALIELHARGR